MEGDDHEAQARPPGQGARGRVEDPSNLQNHQLTHTNIYIQRERGRKQQLTAWPDGQVRPEQKKGQQETSFGAKTIHSMAHTNIPFYIPSVQCEQQDEIGSDFLARQNPLLRFFPRTPSHIFRTPLTTTCHAKDVS